MSTPRELREKLKAELSKLPADDRQAHGFRGAAPDPAPPPTPLSPASPTGLAPNPAQGSGAPLPTQHPTVADAVRAAAAGHFH